MAGEKVDGDDGVFNGGMVAGGVDGKDAVGEGDQATEAIWKRRPYTPTQHEILEHLSLHLPYRSWCRACVLGKCLDEASRTITRPDDREQYCRQAMDYMLLTQNMVVTRAEGGGASEAGGEPADRARNALMTLVVNDFS